MANMPRKKIKDPHASREAKKYDNPVASREWLLNALDELPRGYEELCSLAQVNSDEQREALRRRLRAMLRDGQVTMNRRNLFVPTTNNEAIAGKVLGHRDGYGFFRPADGSEDLFLNQKQMQRVFDGDEVLARPGPIDRRGKQEAIIIEITSRKHTNIVGRYVDEGYMRYVLADNQKITQKIAVIPGEELDARDGQMVVVELDSFPNKKTLATGRVTQVLGDKLAPGMEIEVAIHSHQIPAEWSDEILRIAAALPEQVQDDEKTGRIDLRSLPLVTIDGEDARDFDDAVYVARKKSGGWRLYVAIADVSHYVQPNSALDTEAISRGNSTYFPGYVVPMLPEELSNGLCSLNPHVDRLAMVCEMTISERGKVSGYKFYEAVIHSHARLTYTQVARALDGDEDVIAQLAPRLDDLKNMHDLYRVLRGQRDIRGAIDFETVEPRIIFGPGRKIEKIIPVERNDAHKMIEECMLAANVCAAQLLEKFEVPALYRVHEGPTQERLENLRSYLGELGLTLQGSEQPTPGDYQDLLDQIQERPDAHIIQTMMLRSMAQAQYRPDNEGHFGLSYKAYTHFTSPIRRYPDLLVHRAIRGLVRNAEGRQLLRADDAKPLAMDKIYPYQMAEMLQAGEQCSLTERRSDEATRDVIAWLKCEFLEHRLGETFQGTIAAVTSFGLFIELDELFVEGLAHISNLSQDFYHYDQVKQRLQGERSGKSFSLGDKVMVRVARVDLDERKVDLEVIDHETRRTRTNKQTKKSPRRRAVDAEAEKKPKPKAKKKPKGAVVAKDEDKLKAKKAKSKAKVKKKAAKKKAGKAKKTSSDAPVKSIKSPRRRKAK